MERQTEYLVGPAIEIEHARVNEAFDAQGALVAVVYQPWVKFGVLFSRGPDSMNARLEGGQVKTFIAIALRIGEGQDCWPTIETIAEDSGQDSRTVQRHLYGWGEHTGLVNLGLIQVCQRPGFVNTYTVTRFAAYGKTPVMGDRGRGDTGDGGGVTPMTPKEEPLRRTSKVEPSSALRAVEEGENDGRRGTDRSGGVHKKAVLGASGHTMRHAKEDTEPGGTGVYPTGQPDERDDSNDSNGSPDREPRSQDGEVNRGRLQQQVGEGSGPVRESRPDGRHSQKDDTKPAVAQESAREVREAGPSRPKKEVRREEYVDDPFETPKPAIVAYIEAESRNLGVARNLTPVQIGKLERIVQQSKRYDPPDVLFQHDPLFKLWIREQIKWANNGDKRKPTQSLVSAIRNYEREGNGWKEWRQGYLEAQANLRSEDGRTTGRAKGTGRSPKAGDDPAYRQLVEAGLLEA